jgi:hypothetical protein
MELVCQVFDHGAACQYLGVGHEDCASGKPTAGPVAIVELTIGILPDAAGSAKMRREIMRRPPYRQTCWPLTSTHLLEGSCRRGGGRWGTLVTMGGRGGGGAGRVGNAGGVGA